jgi:hypothetical protein
LREALGMWPADLCVACKLAEGDTVACRECGRFLHEECDGDNNMDRLICVLCKAHRPVHAADDGEDEERDIGGIELDGEHHDSSGEEEEEEQNLTGFVVDDDHVSFSSGPDALAGVDEGDYGDEVEIVDTPKKHKKDKKKHKKRAKKEEQPEPEPPQPLKKAKKENRRVIESPVEQPPLSGSSRSQKILDLVESSSAAPSPEKKKKKSSKPKKKEEPAKKKSSKHIFLDADDDDDDDDFK